MFDCAAERAAAAACMRQKAAAAAGDMGGCCGAPAAGRSRSVLPAGVEAEERGSVPAADADRLREQEQHEKMLAEQLRRQRDLAQEPAAGHVQADGLQGGGGFAESDTRLQAATEDALAGLIDMGFTEEQATTALHKFRGSADRAADWLVSGGGCSSPCVWVCSYGTRAHPRGA